MFRICCEEIVFVKDVEIVLEFWDWIEMICCDGNSRDGGGMGNLEVIFFFMVDIYYDFVMLIIYSFRFWVKYYFGIWVFWFDISNVFWFGVVNIFV